MFQVLERDGQRRAVYSRGDLEYMMFRGWVPVDPNPKPVDAAPVPQIVVEPRVKRAYTRRK